MSLVVLERNIRLEALYKSKELYIKDFKEIMSMLISREVLTSDDITDVLSVTDKIVMNIEKLEAEISEEENK